MRGSNDIAAGCFCCFCGEITANKIKFPAEILGPRTFGEAKNSEWPRCFFAVVGKGNQTHPAMRFKSLPSYHEMNKLSIYNAKSDIVVRYHRLNHRRGRIQQPKGGGSSRLAPAPAPAQLEIRAGFDQLASSKRDCFGAALLAMTVLPLRAKQSVDGRSTRPGTTSLSNTAVGDDRITGLAAAARSYPAQRGSPSPGSLHSPPSPALQERGRDA